MKDCKQNAKHLSRYSSSLSLFATIKLFKVITQHAAQTLVKQLEPTLNLTIYFA